MRRSPIIFVILNILISAAVAYGVIQALPTRTGESQIVPITVQVQITATPDPNGEATRLAFAVENTLEARLATLQPAAVPLEDLPPEVQEDLNVQVTIDPETLSADPQLASTANALPDGCILHTVAEGENPSIIAEEYNVGFFAIMNINGLTEETATQLQIGDVLIVPLPNCPLDEIATPEPPTPEGTPTETPTETPAISDTPDESAEPTEPPTETPTPTPSPTATLALAPTSVNAQVEIVEFLSVGDITAEGVRIINNGSAVDITGWTLADAEGNTYTFPEQRLFTGSSITIYTRSGEDTPVVLFWGRNTAVWGDDNEVATLTNANDQVQSSVRVP